MSSSRSGDGSSSTTIAMLRMASRNRRGMEARASATRRSKSGLFILDPPLFPRGLRALDGDDLLEVLAVVRHCALVAQRLGSADPASMEDEGIGRPRPALGRQRAAQLLLDDLGLVRFGDTNPIGDAENVPVDRQARHPE